MASDNERIEELEMRVATLESAIYSLADSMEYPDRTLAQIFKHAGKPHMSPAVKKYKEWSKGK